jgi:glycogen debranching enzyme
VEAPVPYPVACAPQAWAAAAPLLVLQVLLGLKPRAGEGLLELDHPSLPAGVRSLSLTGLRVGSVRLDLLFYRRRGATAVEVVSKTGELEVLIRA